MTISLSLVLHSLSLPACLPACFLTILLKMSQLSPTREEQRLPGAWRNLKSHLAFPRFLPLSLGPFLAWFSCQNVAKGLLSQWPVPCAVECRRCGAVSAVRVGEQVRVRERDVSEVLEFGVVANGVQSRPVHPRNTLSLSHQPSVSQEWTLSIAPPPPPLLEPLCLLRGG